MEAMLKLVEWTTKGKASLGEALTDSDDIEGYLLTFEHLRGEQISVGIHPRAAIDRQGPESLHGLG